MMNDKHVSTSYNRQQLYQPHNHIDNISTRFTNNKRPLVVTSKSPEKQHFNNNYKNQMKSANEGQNETSYT